MENSDKLSHDDKLRAENDFLKMKLMLEHGAQFDNSEDKEDTLPPDIENTFLQNVMAFEKQFEEHKMIKVFDKIGRPLHFKPAGEIDDGNIEQAWHELSHYMSEHDVNLDICSPNISPRELYRFATEELFQYEMDDINLPGWTTNFIYDEFYPDPVYDNSKMVEQDLLGDIFRKAELFHELNYANCGFLFNGILYNEFKVFNEKISRFKSLFDKIELLNCTVHRCVVADDECYVNGRYNAGATMEETEIIFDGEFNVKLILSDLGYWDMKEIEICGFNIP